MMSHIKDCIKKFKKYTEDKKKKQEVLQQRYPADYIYIGSYEETVKDHGIYITHTHTDAFLIDNKFQPSQAIRLTGEDTTFQPVTLYPSLVKSSKYYSSYDLGDNGIYYHICTSPSNQPWYANSDYLSLESIIEEMKNRNKRDLAYEREQYLKQRQ